MNSSIIRYAPKEDMLKPGVILWKKGEDRLKYLLLTKINNGLWECLSLYTFKKSIWWTSYLLEDCEIIVMED